MTDKAFVRLSAVAALIMVGTTVGVHFVTFPSDTFEQRVMLYQNSAYHLRTGMVVVHCVLAIVSLMGFVVRKRMRAEPLGATLTGMIFFTLFGFTEIMRMMFSAWFANGLRERYAQATDEAARLLMRHELDLWSLMGNSFFLVFILCFALGNLFYGLSLFRDSEVLTRWLGYGFLLWSLLTFLAMGNDFWDNAVVGAIAEVNNKYFQPFMRLTIGVWLWRSAGS